MSSTPRLLATLALPVVFLVAACGGGDATTAPSGDVAVPTGPAVNAVELADSSLGQILVNRDGMTLYGFAEDPNPTESSCYDTCAENWPPLIGARTATAGEGLNQADLTKFDRTDGAVQLAYGGWPLYTYSGDFEAGDTNGQGVGAVWWVIGADGEFIQ